MHQTLLRTAPGLDYCRYRSSKVFSEQVSSVADRARLSSALEYAAGQAILEAAGGQVETLDGSPLGYGKADFKNGGFLAWGRRD